MTNAIRISCVALLAACVVWIAASRGETKPAASEQPVSERQTQIGQDDGLELAARYHLRSRTSRFYQRAGKGRSTTPRVRTHRLLGADQAPANAVAGRYHLRGRTAKFYKRAVC